jgi:hypothetical protein
MRIILQEAKHDSKPGDGNAPAVVFPPWERFKSNRGKWLQEKIQPNGRNYVGGWFCVAGRGVLSQ